MRIHAILDRAVFKTGETDNVNISIYDSDGKPLVLQTSDIITINAKRWIDSEEYLLEDTSCSITDAAYGECEFLMSVGEDAGLGRYLAEITLQRIVDGVTLKSSDITMWIDRGI
jgi:hypothetical protein